MNRLSIARTTFLITMFIFGALLTTNAQRFTLGPKLGVNMASVKYYPEGFDDPHLINSQFISVVTGVVANYEFVDRFSIQTEVLFSRKGHKMDLSWDTTDYSQDGYRKLAMNYLEVPVLFKVFFGPDEVRGYLNAGPYWGYWMNGKEVYKLDQFTTGEPEVTTDLSDDIDFENGYIEGVTEANRVDFGVTFGGGFAYESGPGFLLIDFRYSMGLRDLQNWIDETQKPDDYKENLNRVFSISFGYVYEF